MITRMESDEQEHPCEGCPRWDDGQCDGKPENCTANTPAPDEAISGQIEAIWAAISRLENQLGKICADVDDLRHREVSGLKTDIWQIEANISKVESDLQSVERACRY